MSKFALLLLNVSISESNRYNTFYFASFLDRFQRLLGGGYGSLKYINFCSVSDPYHFDSDRIRGNF